MLHKETSLKIDLNKMNIFKSRTVLGLEKENKMMYSHLTQVGELH